LRFVVQKSRNRATRQGAGHLLHRGAESIAKHARLAGNAVKSSNNPFQGAAQFATRLATKLRLFVGHHVLPESDHLPAEAVAEILLPVIVLSYISVIIEITGFADALITPCPVLRASFWRNGQPLGH
jgi:hypothetical protein